MREAAACTDLSAGDDACQYAKKGLLVYELRRMIPPVEPCDTPTLDAIGDLSAAEVAALVGERPGHAAATSYVDVSMSQNSPSRPGPSFGPSLTDAAITPDQNNAPAV